MADEWEAADDGFAPENEPRQFTPRKPTFNIPDPDAPRFGSADTGRVLGNTFMGQLTQETARFEHACCKAVRPNPDDPTIVDAGEREPYLVDSTPLRPTAVFGAYLGMAGLLAVLPFLFAWLDLSSWLEITSASLAGAILLFLFVSILLTRSALGGLQMEAVRHIEEEKIERGTLFHATLDNAGSVIPGGLRVTITDQKAPGLRPVEPPTIEGIGAVRYKVRPQARGLVTFKGFDVRIRSASGLWVQDREYRFRTTVEVGPSTAAISWNSVLSGYVPFDKSVNEQAPSLVKLYREVENELVREYLPGDRMKDVDWRRYAVSGKMTIRRRWTDPETTVIMMFDMGRSMLMDQAGYRNIDLAAEVAQEMMQWSLSRNHETGMVAFDEERILDHVRPTRAKIQMKKLDEHLKMICDYKLPEEWGEDGPPEIMIVGDPENLRMGVQTGIKSRNTATASIILFSDMQTIHEDVVQTLSKAAESGIPVIAMFMPPPGLRPYRPDAKPGEDDVELRGEEQARGMRDLLLARGAEFLEIKPFPEETALFTEAEMEAYRQGMMDQDTDGDGLPDELGQPVDMGGHAPRNGATGKPAGGAAKPAPKATTKR